MGVMTFVVEYEDGKEPKIEKDLDVLGGRLTAAAFYDYRDDLLTEDEADAVSECLSNYDFHEVCDFHGVSVESISRKLGI
ncbi:hypothetical protein [Morganella sp. GD04133]|uniref:hypothetical protein n=1 Tax=Morganella sp. GD04133 TaxID=2975435 RepID=UPI0024485B07|nr:hypothetical protein [Morganella sp. GD04133]MDH0357060.1 hypothetical protein [Morganella sp. GD04133]